MSHAVASRHATSIFALAATLSFVHVAGAQTGADDCPADDLGTLSGTGSFNVSALSGAPTNNFPAPNSGECPLPCNDWGSGNDVIFTFQVDTAGSWVFRKCDQVFFAGSMQIRSGGACPGDTCLGADDGGCSNCLGAPAFPGVEIVVDLTPGVQYWLIADAKVQYDFDTPTTGLLWSDVTYEMAAGGCGDGVVDDGEECDPPDPFTCDESCQFLPGNDCADPIVIDLDTELPYIQFNTTCNRGDAYNSGTCISGVPIPPGTGNFTAGEDIIYELTTSQDICLNIAVNGDIPDSSDFIGFAIDDACPPGLNCLAGSAGGSIEELPLEFLALSAGTYYLLVDNWAPPACIPLYELSLTSCPTAGACCIKDACTDDVDEPECSGRIFLGQTCEDIEVCPPDNDLCADAIAIGEGVTPFDTAGATPDPNGGESCTFPLFNEVWYQYTATFTGPAVFDTCGPAGDDGPDTIMQIYAGCDCPPSGATLACVNDSAGCGAGGLSSRAVLDVFSGTCYTVRLSGFFDNDELGELSIESFTCSSPYDCGDILPQDSIRDDACSYYACEDGFCQISDKSTQGDMGGSNGACPVDGACDGNDNFHALNCFSNTTTAGMFGYPCEEAPPGALNVDAGSNSISCVLDGVCDGNDAFHALNCFSDLDSQGIQPYPCSCGPQPDRRTVPLRSRPHSAVTLLAPQTVRPGDHFEVEVFLDDELDALRGYQLHIAAEGGERGTMELIDIAVDGERRDHVFASAAGTWSAFNRDISQMVVGMNDPNGVPSMAGAYLATLTYRVSSDATGAFVVDLLYAEDAGINPAERTFLFGRYAAPVDISSRTPAVVHVLGEKPMRQRSTSRRDP